MSAIKKVSTVLMDEFSQRWTLHEKELAIKEARAALEQAVIHRAAAILLGKRTKAGGAEEATKHLRLSAAFAGNCGA